MKHNDGTADKTEGKPDHTPIDKEKKIYLATIDNFLRQLADYELLVPALQQMLDDAHQTNKNYAKFMEQRMEMSPHEVSDAYNEWIVEHLQNLVDDIRPEGKGDLTEFDQSEDFPADDGYVEHGHEPPIPEQLHTMEDILSELEPPDNREDD